MDILELEQAVNNIEQDISDTANGVDYFNITLTSNGFVQIVDFIGLSIWDSEFDNRSYGDEGDESTREPIEPHLRKLLREELKKLSCINI